MAQVEESSNQRKQDLYNKQQQESKEKKDRKSHAEEALGKWK